VLLSALAQDHELERVEGRALRDALGQAHLSLELATFGSWVAITQRVGGRFRAGLRSDDPDERARVRGLFADPPAPVLDMLLSTDLTHLLAAVNTRRNSWRGHSGAAGQSRLAEQVDQMTAQVTELRQIMGSLWQDYPLVRAGALRKHGDTYQQTVELMLGATTPFRTEQVDGVGAGMDDGQLYLYSRPSRRAIPLVPLVQLRASPGSAEYACYFFNRLDGPHARMVSYHFEKQEELVEPADTIRGFLAGLQDPPD
jgi:hypothetical protein